MGQSPYAFLAEKGRRSGLRRTVDYGPMQWPFFQQARQNAPEVTPPDVMALRFRSEPADNNADRRQPVAGAVRRARRH
jgi:hypothetical protein